MSHWEQQTSGNRTRIAFRSEGAVCTNAYTISQRRSRKALYHMLMQLYNMPIDWGLINLCKDAKYGFNCISPWPQPVGVSHPAGNTAQWSDIGYGPESEKFVEPEKYSHLVYPVRMKIPDMLDGKTAFRSQYPELAPPMSIAETGAAVSHGEILDVGIESRNRPPTD
jgi:hypothetical protein